MKKSLALLMALVMVFALAGSTAASAATAQYSTTQEFLDFCDRNGIYYTYGGFGSLTNGSTSTRESVTTRWSGDNIDDLSVTLAFDSDLETVRLYAWSIIDYNSYNYSALLEVVNNLNAQFFWVKFYCDTSDNSISGEISIPIRSGVVGELAYDALYSMVSIIDDAYPSLQPYAK